MILNKSTYILQSSIENQIKITQENIVLQMTDIYFKK